MIQRLGRAVDKGRTGEVADLRRLLEQNYLRGQVRYELLFERYDPLDKWKTGKSQETRRLASFESGDAE